MATKTAVESKESALVTMPIISPDTSEVFTEEGYMVGYAATWHVDSVGDQFQKGAFTKTIKESIGKHKIPLMVRHASNGGEVEDVVGVITDAREDDYGLLIWGKWHEDEKSNEIRKKVVGGKVDGLSVGYQEMKREGNTIKEARLIETTITVKPCNVRARILDAKSLDQPETLPVEEAVDTGLEIARIRMQMELNWRLKNHVAR
jgi:HK97 family phage prohead protease